MIDKIVEGKLKKFFKESTLLEQPFVKDPDKSVQDVINETITKCGENISVRRFVRIKVDESIIRTSTMHSYYFPLFSTRMNKRLI